MCAAACGLAHNPLHYSSLGALPDVYYPSWPSASLHAYLSHLMCAAASGLAHNPSDILVIGPYFGYTIMTTFLVPFRSKSSYYTLFVRTFYMYLHTFSLNISLRYLKFLSHILHYEGGRFPPSIRIILTYITIIPSPPLPFYDNFLCTLSRTIPPQYTSEQLLH